jgi:hypothetical protein
MYPTHETGELIDLHQDPVAKKTTDLVRGLDILIEL